MPLRGPYLYPSLVTSYNLSVSYHLSPIHSSDLRGRLLGYEVSYAPMGEPDNKTKIQVGANSTMVTLRHLKGGLKYIIAAAGLTRKGIGRYSLVSSTCKLNVSCPEFETQIRSLLITVFKVMSFLFSDSHNIRDCLMHCTPFPRCRGPAIVEMLLCLVIQSFNIQDIHPVIKHFIALYEDFDNLI